MRALVCTILFATSASQPLQPPVHADEHDHRIGQLFFESTTALPGGAEQLWLAYGATPDAVGISWLTNATGAQSLVRYGTVNGSLTLQATGAASTYSCGAYSSGSIHRVNLTGLAPATTYFYQVGDDSTGASTLESCGLTPYLAYKSRFATMPSGGREDGALYYSYSVGPAHVIVLATFFVYSEGSAQYDFLVADLAAIDRTLTPWVFVIVHAPWYSSNTVHQGDGELMRLTLEPLLRAAQVNAVFAGHVHAYERFVGVYDNAADAAGPIYVTIGDGGNREGLYNKWVTPQPAISAYRDAEYGHGELTLHNASVATWAWVRNADPEPRVTDSVVIQNVAAAGVAAAAAAAAQ